MRAQPVGVGLAMIAGAATSVGPCAAPRYVAVVSLRGSEGGIGRWVRTGAYIAGVTAGSIAIVLSSSLLANLVRVSSFVYLTLALGFLAAGLWSVFRREEPRHCVHHVPTTGVSLSLGIASAFVVSPCCTPVLVALGAIAGNTGNAGYVLMVAAAFVAGHTGALVAIARSFDFLRDRFGAQMGDAMNTVAAGLLIALSLYYAVLA